MVEIQTSREAEYSVLGTLMVEPTGFSRVYAIVKNEDFFFPETRKVYSTMQTLFSRNIEINIQTILNYFKVEGYTGLSEPELREFLDYRVSVETAVSFAVQIAEFSGWRSLRLGLETITKEVNNHGLTLPQASEKLSTLVSSVTSKGLKDDILHGASMMEEYMQMLDRPKNMYTFSGIREIDDFIFDFNPKELSIVAARPGSGKALPTTALILTPSGWVENGSLKVGSEVIGSDGKPYKILGVYPQGKRKAYRVTFSDDSYVICDLEHLWETQTRKERKGKKKATVKTTKEILETLKVNRDNRLNHSIKLVKPVEFFEQHVSVDPYLLGLYLGDGNYQNNPRIYSMDNEILDYLKNQKGSYFTSRSLRAFRFSTEFSRALDELGLKNKKSFDKFIPKNYIFNSIDVRLSILQGLLDTDGYVSGSHIEYSSASKDLADGVREIVLSLGGRAKITRRMGSYKLNGVSKTTIYNYRVSISFPDNGIVPFRLSRKVKNFKPQTRFQHKFIKDISFEDAEVEMQCIAVNSPDSLFVTTDYNLTHNTAFMLQSALNNAFRGNRVGFLSMEMERPKLLNRLVSHEATISGTKIVRMSPEEFMSDSKLVSTLERITNLPIFIDDTGPWTSETVPQKIRKMFYEYQCNLIYVDYIGLIAGAGTLAAAPKNQQISAISAQLKGLASELSIPILAASQLNRDVEKRADNRPFLADLRDSGSLEQDASIVAFLYPNVGKEVNPDENPKLFESITELPVTLEIAKQRNGPINSYELVFYKKYGRFRSRDEVNATY